MSSNGPARDHAESPVPNSRTRFRSITTKTIRFENWLIVIAFITLLRLMIALFFGSSSPSFAGDEATYVSLLLAMESPDTFNQWGSGFSLQLYPASRSFLFPAHILHSIGIDAFYAVRLTSIMYASALSVLFVYVVYSVQSGNRLRRFRNLLLKSRYTLAILLMILWPSLNVWFVVGLKESTSLFWILVALFSTVVVLGSHSRKVKVLALLLVVVGIASVYQVRDYLGTVIVFATAAVALASLHRLPKQPTRSLVATAVLLAGIAVGATAGMALAKPLSIELADAERVPNLDGSSSVNDQGEVTPPELRPYTQLGEGLLEAPLSATDARQDLSTNAESAVPIECVELDTTLSRLLCEAKRLPAATIRAAVFPIALFPGLTDSDSLSARFASIENVGWLILFVWVGVTISLYRSNNRLLTFGLIVYAGLVLLGLAVFGGNLGTIFRHKAQFLPFLLLLIAISSTRRREIPTGRHASARHRHPKPE